MPSSFSVLSVSLWFHFNHRDTEDTESYGDCSRFYNWICPV